jgi:hypothetical protein
MENNWSLRKQAMQHCNCGTGKCSHVQSWLKGYEAAQPEEIDETYQEIKEIDNYRFELQKDRIKFLERQNELIVKRLKREKLGSRTIQVIAYIVIAVFITKEGANSIWTVGFFIMLVQIIVTAYIITPKEDL